LKPERWGSPLVQEKYRGEKACDKRHPYCIIVVIIIIIIIINIQSVFNRNFHVVYMQSVMNIFYKISGILWESEGANLRQRTCGWKRPLDSEIVVDRWCVTD
jgi:hypothetical protein